MAVTDIAFELFVIELFSGGGEVTRMGEGSINWGGGQGLCMPLGIVGISPKYLAFGTLEI